MKQPHSDCQPDRLSDLLVGTLSDVDSDAMLSHLESCPSCQLKLEKLAAQDSQWKYACEVLGSSQDAFPKEHADTSSYRSIHEKGLQWNESLSRRLLSPASHPEMLGRIGRYDIERFIGAGGMGIVFKGFDTELNRPVAIKVLSPSLAFNGTARQRFAREARAAAAVVHEHVVPIYNVESNGELPFLVMHFAQGESLQTKLDREGPLELKQILRIGKQIAAGLAAAHAQGLVHRDVKPANVLLEEGIDRALLTDFGLAQTADDASLTCSGYLPGTPQYMSPEQARGEKVSGLSDLFSTGSVLYSMSTGRPPFRAETSLGVLRKINDSEPKRIREINPDLPDWFCRIVERLMAKRPEDRYGSAHEVAELLENCLAHVQQPLQVALPTSLRVPSSLALIGDKIRRHRILLAIGLSISGSLGLILWSQPKVLETKSASSSDALYSSVSSGDRGEDTPLSSPVIWRGAPPPRVPQDDIRAKLQTLYPAHWNDTPFKDAIKELMIAADLDVDFNPSVLEIMTDLDPSPVTLTQNLTVKAILHQVLRERGLAYIVHEENIEIALEDYALSHPTVHRYDLSHVTANSLEANQLVNLIQSVVEPQEWNTAGGNCSLGLIGPVLHVRATESMHDQIASLLASLKK